MSDGLRMECAVRGRVVRPEGRGGGGGWGV